MQSTSGNACFRSSTLSALASSSHGVFAPGPLGESPSERLERLYRHPGGPLLGWLGDEAIKKGHSHTDMSRELGVTLGYLLQLCNGIRNVGDVSQAFLDACARYLGTPTIVCKVLAGNIRMSDFHHKAASENDALERCITKIMGDPERSKHLPSNPRSMETSAKQALVLMHTRVEHEDFLGVKGLPKVMQWLQRCAVDCDEQSGKALQSMN